LITEVAGLLARLLSVPLAAARKLAVLTHWMFPSPSRL
jgi:hypothetical protein